MNEAITRIEAASKECFEELFELGMGKNSDDKYVKVIQEYLTAEYLRSEQVIAELQEEVNEYSRNLKNCNDNYSKLFHEQEQVIKGLVEALKGADKIASRYEIRELHDLIEQAIETYYNSIKPNNTETK